jgi:hypothetical protein
MADTTLGLTDYAKEMARWNAPYTYQEFPKMLYRAATTTAGRVELEQPPRTVTTAGAEQEALAAGWCPNPQTALDRETTRQEAIGTAAAERAFADRRMSAAAQAEAQAADAAAGAKHLGEIRERPRRPRPPKKKAPIKATAKPEVTP